MGSDIFLGIWRGQNSVFIIKCLSLWGLRPIPPDPLYKNIVSFFSTQGILSFCFLTWGRISPYSSVAALILLRTSSLVIWSLCKNVQYPCVASYLKRLYARTSLTLDSHSTHWDNCITVTGRLNLGPLGIHKGKRALSWLEKVSECWVRPTPPSNHTHMLCMDKKQSLTGLTEHLLLYIYLLCWVRVKTGRH